MTRVLDLTGNLALVERYDGLRAMIANVMLLTYLLCPVYTLPGNTLVR
jgi:hypothetical protein